MEAKINFQCDICPATYPRVINISVTQTDGVLYLCREIPINWSYVRGFMLCGKHTFEISENALRIDGKLFKVYK